MPNMKKAINQHNSKILNNENQANGMAGCTSVCDDECPLPGNCTVKNVVYRATVTRSDNHRPQKPTQVPHTEHSGQGLMNTWMIVETHLEQVQLSVVTSGFWKVWEYHMRSNGKLLAGHSPTILPLASAGSAYLRSTTLCSTRMDPASTKGQNFFPTVITNPLYFFQTKNLHDTKLGASSKFQNKKIFSPHLPQLKFTFKIYTTTYTVF